jgi:hypothetical protein
MKRPSAAPAAPSRVTLLPLELPITGLQVELGSDVLKVSVWTERTGLVDLVELPYTVGTYSKTLRELANDAFQRALELDLQKLSAPRPLEHVG